MTEALLVLAIAFVALAALHLRLVTRFIREQKAQDLRIAELKDESAKLRHDLNNVRTVIELMEAGVSRGTGHSAGRPQ